MLNAATLDQVYALAATVDTKEAYGMSIPESCKYAETIGNNIGLSSDELADLRGASLLHDIGKWNLR